MLTRLIAQTSELYNKDSYSSGLSSIFFVIKVLYQASDTQLISFSKNDFDELWRIFIQLKNKVVSEQYKNYLDYLLSILERYSAVTRSTNLTETICAVQNECAHLTQQGSDNEISLQGARTSVSPPIPAIKSTLEALKHLLQAHNRLKQEGIADLIQQQKKINELLLSYYLKISEVMLPEEMQRLHNDLFVSQKQGLAEFKKDLAKLFIAFDRRLSLGLYESAGELLNYRPNQHHSIHNYPINELLEKLFLLNQKILSGSRECVMGSNWQVYRSELVDIRQKIKKLLLAMTSEHTESEIVSIQAQLTDDVQHLVESLFNHTQVFIGHPICSYVYAWTGSHALKAAALGSDIEGWLVIEEKSPQTLRYWQAFLAISSLEMEAIGESDAQIAGMHFDAFPSVIDAQSLQTNGIYTPECYLDELTDDILAEDNQRAYPLCLAGDQKLYSALLTNLNRIRMNNASWHEMLRRAAFSFQSLPWQKNTTVSQVDLKKDCIQPLIVCLIRLRYYFQLPDTVGRHPLQIIRGLEQQGYIESAYANYCAQTLTRWYQQRLLIQMEADNQHRPASDEISLTDELRNEIAEIIIPILTLTNAIVVKNDPGSFVGQDPRYFPDAAGQRIVSSYQQKQWQQWINTYLIASQAGTSEISIQLLGGNDGFLPNTIISDFIKTGLFKPDSGWSKASNTAHLMVNNTKLEFTPISQNSCLRYASLLFSQYVVGRVFPQTSFMILSYKNQPMAFHVTTPNYRKAFSPSFSAQFLMALFQGLSTQGGEGDYLLLESVMRQGATTWLTHQNAIFYQDAMQSRFSPFLREEILQLHPQKLCEYWLDQLTAVENLAGVQTNFSAFVPAELDSSSLPQTLTTQMVKKNLLIFQQIIFLSSRLVLLQQVLRETADITHLQLLQRTDAMLGAFSTLLLRQYDTWEKRVKAVQQLPRILTTEQGACSLIVYQAYAAAAAFGVAEHTVALSEILTTQPQASDTLKQILSNFLLKKENKQQTEKDRFQDALVFEGEETQSYKQLETLLKSFANLEVLILKNNASLTDQGLLKMIANKCPRLRRLHLIRQTGLLALDDKTTFPLLELLDVNACKKLMSLSIRAPKLLYLRLTDAVDIQHYDCAMPNLRFLEISGWSITAERLKYLIISLRAEKLETVICDQTLLFDVKAVVQAAIQELSNTVKKGLELRSAAKQLTLAGFEQLGRKECKEALVNFNEAVRLYPQSFKALCGKAQAHLLLNEVDDAHKTITHALKIKSKNPQGVKIRALVFQRQQKYMDAIRDFSTVIRMAKDKDPTLYYERASCKYKQGDFEEALLDFRMADKIEKSNANTIYYIGLCYANINQFQTALLAFSTAILINPNVMEYYTNRATTLFKLEEYDLAIADCDYLLQISPLDGLTHILKGKILLAKKESTLALQVLTKALEYAPESYEAYTQQAAAFYELKKYNDAVSACEFAIRIKSDYGQAYLQRALCNQVKNKLQDALQDINTAIKLVSGNADFYRTRGNIQFALGNHEQGLADLNYSRQLSPPSSSTPGAKSNKVNVELLYLPPGEEEKERKKIAECNLKLRKFPNDAVLFNNRGLAKLHLGDFQGALKDITVAISKNSKAANFYCTRSVIYIKLENYQQAKADSEQALRLDPNNVIANANFGTVKTYLGDLAGAIPHLDKVIAINSSNVLFFINRGGCYYFLGEYQKAIPDLETARNMNPNHVYGRTLLGMTYIHLFQTRQGEVELQTALQICPNYMLAVLAIGMMQYLNGDYVTALRTTNSALRMPSESWHRVYGLLVRAKIKMQLADFSEAIHDFDAVIEEDKLAYSINLAYYWRACCKYILNRNISFAMPDIMYLQGQKPDESYAIFSMGFLKMMQRDFNAARVYFEQIFRLRIHKPDFQHFTAAAEIALGLMDWLEGKSATLLSFSFHQHYNTKTNFKGAKSFICGDVLARFMFDVLVQPQFNLTADKLVPAFIDVLKILNTAQRDYPDEIKLFYYQAALYALVGQAESAQIVINRVKTVDSENLLNTLMLGMPTLEAGLASKLNLAIADVPELNIVPDESQPTESSSALSSSSSHQTITSVLVSTSTSSTQESTTSEASRTTPVAIRKALPPAPKKAPSEPASSSAIAPQAFFPATPKGMSGSSAQLPSSSAAASSPVGKGSMVSERKGGFFSRLRSSGDTDVRKEGKKEKKALKK